MTWVDSSLRGVKEKEKGSLMTPLRPGDLVPTAYSLGKSRAVKTKLVMAVKNQPKWLCSQSVTRDTSSSRSHPATGVHLSPVIWVCHWKSDGIISWHYRSGKVKISARKNVQFGGCAKTRGVGAVWGLRRQTPRSWVNSVWLHFQGSPWDTWCPISDHMGTAMLPAATPEAWPD